jgi:hypothetical protein
MRLATFTLAAAAVLAAAPAFAQGASKPDITETFRTRSVTVFGSDPCPTSTNSEEVVVCARRPEEERYRLPNPTPRPGDRVETSNSQRLAETLDSGQAGGVGSCTTVGPGGGTGCFLRGATTSRKTARQNQATENPETPESITGRK